jgi:hypothetical protein
MRTATTLRAPRSRRQGPWRDRRHSAEAQLPDFVTEIERLINGAAERVIAQGLRRNAAEPGPLAAIAGVGRRAAAEPLNAVAVAASGQSRDPRSHGPRRTRPWPSLRHVAAARPVLARHGVDGTGGVQYNFVRDDRAAPPARSTFPRATRSGSFTGGVDLHGELPRARSCPSSCSRAHRA